MLSVFSARSRNKRPSTFLSAWKLGQSHLNEKERELAGEKCEKKNEGEIETQNRLKVGFVIFFRSVFDEKNCGS